MKNKFYYIHLNSVDLCSGENETIIDSRPNDYIFISNGFWSSRKIEKNISTRLKLSIELIQDFQLGENLNSFEESPFYPKELYRLIFQGEAMVDDLGVYDEKYLIASDIGLSFLKEFGLVNIRYDQICVSLITYFSSYKHLFWMPEKHREIFIKKFVKN
jgi:hypothetical protein